MNAYKHFSIGLLFIIVLTFGLSMTSRAEEGFNLWIGETEVNSETSSGEGWSYDQLSHTLTLDGFSYTGGLGHTDNRVSSVIFYSGSEPLTVYLADTSMNLIQQSSWNSTAAVKAAGIYCSNADLSIVGAGSLNIKSGQIKSTAYYSETYGIYCNGNLQLFDGNVTATGSYINGEGNCHGVFGKSIIVNGGDLTAEGAGTSDGGCVAIKCINMIVNRGNVSAKSLKHSYGIGVNASSGFEINGGSLSAEGKRTGITSGNVCINGGTVIALGGTGYGIDGYQVATTIGNKAKSVIAAGGNSAFSREVRNNIPGTGWSDFDGTTGETPISAGDGYKYKYVSYDVIKVFKRIMIFFIVWN